VHKDELFLYYTCLKYRADLQAPINFVVDTDVGAICLATIRRDGFVAAEPASPNNNKTGTLVSKPFTAPAAQLWVNADVRQRCDPALCGTAQLVVTAVLASDGRRISSVPIVAQRSLPPTGPVPLPDAPLNATALGDLPAVEVQWPTPAVKLEGQLLHLEFAVHGSASLYSYWFL
jgi:hypothetical protein